MTILPQQTIQYRSYITETLVQSIAPVFAQHPDALLQSTKVSIGFPRTLADFPSVVCKYNETQIFNAGVGHTETVYIAEESVGNEIHVTLAESGGTQLIWPAVPGATSYNIYRGTASGQENVGFTVTSPTFIDTGLAGTPVMPPADPTSAVPAPVPTIAPQNDGTLSPGTYYYTVTAVGPAEAAKYRHYFYHGNIEFVIYALSAYDRDLIADTLVQTIAMGALEAYTANFLNRIYPSDLTYPYSEFHYINVNTDQLQGSGNNQQATPWGAEDDLMYTNSYSTNVFGELYSLPPKITYALVQKILLYPEEVGYQTALPTGLNFISNSF